MKKNKMLKKEYSKFQWQVIRRITDNLFPIFYTKKSKNIKCVCIFLGPYRNLSTMTSSFLSLHPNCEVLNHAGDRVLGRKKVDFLRYQKQSVMNRFLSFAVYASNFGKKGPYGGGIFHSHAFDNSSLRQIYNKRKDQHIKNDVKCIVWKEPHKVSNYLIEKKIDMGNFSKMKQEIKFILPVRNPIHCVISNKNNNYASFFGSDNLSIPEIMEKLIDQYLFFLNLQQKYPSSYFYIFENEYISQLDDLEPFLTLPKSKEWKNDVINNFHIVDKGKQEEKLIRYCLELVEEKLNDFPIFKTKLINLIKQRGG